MTNLRVPSTRHDGCRRWTANGESLFPGVHRASCVPRAVLEMVELTRTISMSLSSIDLFGFVRSFVREPDKSVLETSVFVLICSERGSADLTITLKEEDSERMYSAGGFPFSLSSSATSPMPIPKRFTKPRALITPEMSGLR